VFWAHWPVPTADVRVRVPDELEIEEHDGTAWLSIVFFRVRALRPRGGRPLPGISNAITRKTRPRRIAASGADAQCDRLR
jgi:hypothetical protein